MVLFQLISKLRPLLKIAATAAGATLLMVGVHYYSHQAWAADPDGNLHTQHIVDQDLACEECHAPQLMIKTESCANCHDPAEVDGYYNLFHEQAAIPGMVPRPRDHADDFRRAHGPAAELDHQRCSMCHTQSSCQDCHEGVNLQARIHPLNFAQTHPFEARGQEAECLTCHETRQFCLDCHRQPGRRAINHPVGSLWANPQEGGAHKDEATGDLESCLACHDMGTEDPVCTQPGCHDGNGGDDE